MKTRAAAFMLLGLAAFAAPALAAQDPIEAPACGARIYVSMGINQNYPGRENMRVPRGDLYLNGTLVGAVSRNPEMAILDVPAGLSELTWVPSSYDDATRNKTTRNPLRLSLADKATAFVVLDWYDDKPNAATVGYRTEVAERDRGAFAGKHVIFHSHFGPPCASETVTAAAAAPAPAGGAPSNLARVAPLPVAKAPPQAVPDDPQPEVSAAFMASLQTYYIVNARAGAPAFTTPNGDITPVYTFPDRTELKVVDTTPDRRWLTVMLPGSNRTAFVSADLVTSGIRAPK